MWERVIYLLSEGALEHILFLDINVDLIKAQDTQDTLLELSILWIVTLGLES